MNRQVWALKTRSWTCKSLTSRLIIRLLSAESLRSTEVPGGDGSFTKLNNEEEEGWSQHDLVSQRGDFNTAYGGGYHFFGQPSAPALLQHARSISLPPSRMHRLLEVLAKHDFQLRGTAANRTHLVRTSVEESAEHSRRASLVAAKQRCWPCMQATTVAMLVIK